MQPKCTVTEYFTLFSLRWLHFLSFVLTIFFGSVLTGPWGRTGPQDWLHSGTVLLVL